MLHPHPATRSRNWIFEGLFWESIVVGLLLMALVLALVLRLDPLKMYREFPKNDADVGVMLATSRRTGTRPSGNG
jgi:hypothetical protein